jgi:hypothetical protein
VGEVIRNKIMKKVLVSSCPLTFGVDSGFRSFPVLNSACYCLVVVINALLNILTQPKVSIMLYLRYTVLYGLYSNSIIESVIRSVDIVVIAIGTIVQDFRIRFVEGNFLQGSLLDLSNS